MNGDCAVDVRDQQQLAFHWGAHVGSLLYDERMDLEPPPPTKGAGAIDIKDVQFVYGRHLSTCENPHPAQEPQSGKDRKPTSTPTTPTPVPTPTAKKSPLPTLTQKPPLTPLVPLPPLETPTPPP